MSDTQQRPVRQPARIMYLARRDPSVRTDAAVLRSLGLPVVSAAGGAEALDLLEKSQGAQVLVCGELLEDMPVLRFLLDLAVRPALRSLPVLVLTASEAARKTLDKAGARTLARPYAAGALAAALRAALSTPRRPLDAAALEAALRAVPARDKGGGRPLSSRPLSVSDLYARAWELLRLGDGAAAEAAFLAVLRRREDHPEACLALARLSREKGDAGRTRRFLLRAAASSLRLGAGRQAGAIAALLPEHMRGPSLLMYEALARLEEGDSRAAARSLLDLQRSRQGARLHAILARACQLTDKPEENLGRMCDALESLGQGGAAGEVRRRLLGRAKGGPGQAGSSWLERFPRLKEAADVASFALRAWRQAG
ncbi:MAG: hypothetical protein LBO77_02580 [Desulfovibrio sp.]|nr:hypothetical protein [Desulfovibrio sp.]